MPRSASLPRPLLLGLAGLFALATGVYSAIWMTYARVGLDPARPLARMVADELMYSFPLLFLAVGFGVLLSRPADRSAWLLALLFASLIGSAPLMEMEPFMHPAARRYAVFFHVVLTSLGPGLFHYFFAVFPVSSPIDRRAPWLKLLLLVPAVAIGLPLAMWALVAGGSEPLARLASRLEEVIPLAALSAVYAMGCYGLGIASLVSNAYGAPSADARRKTRVIWWGTVFGIGPILLVQLGAMAAGRPFADIPYWLWTPCVLITSLIPLAFAYAVVKHRVLELPVLLKRSARYLLVERGFTLLLVMTSIAIVAAAAMLLADYWRLDMGAGVGLGLGVAAVASLLIWAGTRIRERVTERIDRAFFRSAYDARQILQQTAERSRTATSREELAAMLEQQLRQALHPRTLVVYLDSANDVLQAAGGLPPQGVPFIPRDLPLLKSVERRGRPRVPTEEDREALARAALTPPEADCLVPVLGRDGRLAGLVVLGPRLSEEPWSGADKQLLASVASQAGVALETIQLAEQIAERVEAERRASQEMAIAQQVQQKLFPESVVPLETLEYVAACQQARAVGGDFYDFLELGTGRVGLVLADISGKGMAAALLMANLQASLRSRSALALHEPARMLRAVNRALCESSEQSRFCTLFFADYQDATRSLRYINCGHNPPLLLRTDDSLELLEGTATILGAFPDWDCELREAALGPGDILLIYSDGATEAESDDGDMFGMERLTAALRRHRHLPARELLDALAATVNAFSGSEQEDDLTLLVVRSI